MWCVTALVSSFHILLRRVRPVAVLAMCYFVPGDINVATSQGAFGESSTGI